MKTLISWMGFREDFTVDQRTSQINPSGFTGSIHRDIIEAYSFERHIILCTIDHSKQIVKELELKKRSLQSFLKDQYPKHLVELFDLTIDKNDLQNFPVIESNLRSFMARFDASEELHVIAGTGPTSVSMSWAVLNLAMKNRFKLHVLQLPAYSPGGKMSSLVEITPYISPWLDDKLRETHFNTDLPADIYQDEIIIREYEKAKAISPADDINVLILGETGCGKDKMAEFIVKNSNHQSTKYKAINCASLPDELLYSELFGHVKGAFTGAEKDRIGLFEECNGGTLFMDEIGDISGFMQQSLLRAIENNQIKKAGSNEIKSNIKVRIIAATNNNLYEKCESGKFRWDLYYRLCTMEIELQPYRNRTLLERKKIVKYYISKLSDKWGRKINFSASAVKAMELYSFPGNFREIHNTINGLFALGITTIEEEHLPKRFSKLEAAIDESYETALKKHCIAVYKKYNYELAAARNALGYKNSTQLKEKLIEWGVYKI